MNEMSNLIFCERKKDIFKHFPRLFKVRLKLTLVLLNANSVDPDWLASAQLIWICTVCH